MKYKYHESGHYNSCSTSSKVALCEKRTKSYVNVHLKSWHQSWLCLRDVEISNLWTKHLSESNIFKKTNNLVYKTPICLWINLWQSIQMIRTLLNVTVWKKKDKYTQQNLVIQVYIMTEFSFLKIYFSLTPVNKHFFVVTAHCLSLSRATSVH